MRRSFLFSFLLITLVSPGSSAQATDPLFRRMEGQWSGNGTRSFSASGRTVSIRTRVFSLLRDRKLVSRNEVTETPLDARGAPSGPEKTYVREYWIRPSALQNAAPELIYEVGTGEGQEETVTSIGHFVEGSDGTSVLRAEQPLGGQPPYIIRSETHLGPRESHYSETVWHGNQRLSEARIDYQRLP